MRDLFDDLPTADDPVLVPAPAGNGDRAPTIDERFEAFDRANPWVKETLVRMARELVAKGHRRVGIGMLFETLRWSHMRRTSDPHSSFRLNNVLRSRYARAIMDAHADLAGVFETRELKAD